MKRKKKIVFVCTGNTCRSPMAEAVFRALIEEKGLDNIEVSSAGIRVGSSGGLNEKAETVLKENGLSLPEFSSKPLTAKTIRSATVILCMTDDQRDLVMEMRWKVLRALGKTEIENNVASFFDVCGYEIPDPYGGTVEDYRETYRKIDEAKEKIFSAYFTPKKRGRKKKSENGKI